MYDAIILWLHILAAVAFIGPQFFLAFAAVPAIKTIEDVKVRTKAMRVMTMRFGMLGGGLISTVDDYLKWAAQHPEIARSITWRRGLS